MDDPAGADYRLNRLVPLAENRLALAAAHRLLARLSDQEPLLGLSPLYVYGPVGGGKSHFLHGLAREILAAHHAARLTIIDPGEPFTPPLMPGAAARQLEVVLIEDLHRFREHAFREEDIAQLLDCCRLPGRLALVGSRTLPQQVSWLGTRIVSRLLQGLVVCLPAPGPESRVRLAQEFAARRQLHLAQPALEELAQLLPASIRRLEACVSALQQLPTGVAEPIQALQRLLAVETSASEQDGPGRHLARIVERVARFFQVQPRLLRGPRRERRLLLPRQVAMFLARQMTRLPLQRIGRYFGGRDHATVLHACARVRRDATVDPALAGLLHELHSEPAL